MWYLQKNKSGWQFWDDYIHENCSIIWPRRINMLQLLKPLWITIAKYGAIVGSILLILLKARQSGKQVEQRKQAIETLRGVKVRDKIQDEVNSANDADIERMYNQQIKRD